MKRPLEYYFGATGGGLWKTADGGKHWDKILFRNDRPGAIDLCLDPRNSRVLFASLWEVYCQPWVLWSGGEGSGVGSRFGLSNIQGLIVLSQADNGLPVAAMDSIEITIQRTGAATAVAATRAGCN